MTNYPIELAMKQTTPYFQRTDVANEYYTEERCHIIEIMNTPEDRSQSVARARVSPGVTTAWHRVKGTIESYYILSGTGRAEIGQGEQKTNYHMTPHTILKIPCDMPQRITNLGDDDLIFLCFCTPAFHVDNYQSHE